MDGYSNDANGYEPLSDDLEKAEIVEGESDIESNEGSPNENLVQEEMASPAKDTNVHISLVASDLPESNQDSQKSEN